jgi:hypothetical protein
MKLFEIEVRLLPPCSSVIELNDPEVAACATGAIIPSNKPKTIVPTIDFLISPPQG